MENNVYTVVEQMNKENIELKNCKYYKLGKSFYTFFGFLFKLKIKSLVTLIHNKFVKIRLKKYNVNYEEKKSFHFINSIDFSKTKIAIYTCITGGYDNVQIPNFQFSNVDYFLLTDNPSLYEKYKNYYKIIKIDNEKMDLKDNILKNRYAKFHPFQFFSDYDYSIYLDGNIKVVSDIRNFINCLNLKIGIAMHTHRERDCIFNEGIACKLYKRGNAKKIDLQLNAYKQESFPFHYGMLEANVIVCDLKNKVAKKVMNDWWDDFVQKESYRDQLSLPYVLWKNHIIPEEIGTLGSNVYENYAINIEKHL